MCLNRPKVASALGRIDLNEMMSLAINCQVRALSSAGTSPQVLSDDVWHLIIDNVCLNSGLYAGKAVRRLATHASPVCLLCVQQHIPTTCSHCSVSEP